MAHIPGHHPLRLRHVLARSHAQRAASRYALRTFQLPAPAREPARRDGEWVRELFDGGAARGGGPRPVTSPKSARYAAAMRIHPVGVLRGRVFPLAGPFAARADGRRYAAASAAPIHTPVLQLHGALDGCVLPSTAQGSGRYVSR